MNLWHIDDSGLTDHEDRDPKSEDVGMLLVSAGALCGVLLVWAILEIFK